MSARCSVGIWLTVIITSVLLVNGCRRGEQDGSVVSGGSDPEAGGQSQEYNPHDVPITEEQKAQLKADTAQFGAAVEMTRELTNTIKEETKAGIPDNPYQAHQALDKADLVLQWLPHVARDSGMAKEHWEEINTTANQLRTLFENVHQRIDNRQDPDFASVENELNQMITRLDEIAKN
jgi:hypothetical protein